MIKLEVINDYSKLPSNSNVKIRSMLKIKGDKPVLHKNLHVVFVIDSSGSMFGDKIIKVKQAILKILDEITEEDKISMVSFNNVSNVVFKEESIRNKDKLVDALNNIIPGGNTDLFSGFMLGAEIAQNSSHDYVSRIVLLSDGQANKGVVDKNKIFETAFKLSIDSIVTSTFGVGYDFDDELMNGIADNSGGNSYFIDNVGATVEMFLDELEFIRNLSISNCKIKFNPGKNVVKFTVLNDLKHIGNEEIFVGDISFIEDRKIVLEIDIDKLESQEKVKIGDFVVSYGYEGELSRVELLVDVVEKSNYKAIEPNYEVVNESILVMIGKALKAAASLASKRKFNEAADLLENYYKGLSVIPVSNPEITEKVKDLLVRAEKIRNNRERYYTNEEDKYFKYEARYINRNKDNARAKLEKRKSEYYLKNDISSKDNTICVFYDKLIQGGHLEIKTSQIKNVGELLGIIYNRIKSKVPPYSYGVSWVLRSHSTGRVPDIGSNWVKRNNPNAMTLDDYRTLKEANLDFSEKYEVTPINVNISDITKYVAQGKIVIFATDRRLLNRFPMSINYNPNMIASEFLKEIYFKIKDVVPIFSYGKKWLLINLSAQKVIDAGSSWARAAGLDADIRPIVKLGILARDVIELVIF